MNELWVEKYRPRKIEDCILPADIKEQLSQFVKKNYVPNLLLSGGPGIGKTTVAKAMLEECNFDYIMINGSLNGNIDTLRNDISQFASTVSFTGNRKYVILDEADYLNAQSTQPALRNFMEEYSENCGFILTCNYKNRIIPPLHSRCSVVDFRIEKAEAAETALQFMKRVIYILDNENIEYDKKAVAAVIKNHYPDFRRVLNELQRYSATGKIDSGILVNFSDKKFEYLINTLREKNFFEMRKWVGENSDIESTVIFRKLYDMSNTFVDSKTIPYLILHIANYSYKAAFVADQEVNLVACLTEIMSDCTFNDTPNNT